MAAGENRIIRRRIRHAYLSSIVSISLVLLLVGIGSMLLVNTGSVSDWFKEHMVVSVIMKPDVDESQAGDYMQGILEERFIGGAELISREQGESEMKQMLGDDFLRVFETSPIPVSVNVTLKADYVSSDSLKVVEKRLGEAPVVEEVVYQQSLVESLNANLSKISVVIGVFIILLLIISYALIGNTVRLTVYDKRFTIHTMKLVGATRSFIRGPFLLRSALLGLFSAFLAILMLIGILFFIKAGFVQLFEIFRLDLLLIVMGIVIVSGVLICVLSTWMVVNRMVSLDKDELYF
ncbi:MAG: permease-like cell division protein FtsX [Bacteroidales bacterium]|nr:permease-like cell division protein FtsX [Bacteroidales bacterium]